MGFQKATKKQLKLRLGLVGPAGSGKTYTALQIAKGLGGKIAVLDTEHRSAEKYSDIVPFDVDYLTDNCSPERYIQAIKEAEQAGYDVLIIDSLTGAWAGEGGALEMVDNAAKRSKSGNSYTAWRDITPLHNKMINAILASKLHIIATMRSKTEYVMEENANGKKTPRKIGMAPIQREGMDYEFDVVCEIDTDHNCIVGKTRCAAIDGMVIAKPSHDSKIVLALNEWLGSGTECAVDDAPSTQQQEAPKPQIDPVIAAAKKNLWNTAKKHGLDTPEKIADYAASVGVTVPLADMTAADMNMVEGRIIVNEVKG
jgi:hypothetical protein